MILVLDNYDSFTYNLVQYLEELGAEVEVCRNDGITTAQIAALEPEKILLSPGPGAPGQAGICMEVVSRFAGERPILGVCLGHQVIGQVFGGSVVRAPRILHGKTALIHHDGRGVYSGLPLPFEAACYHSLVVARQSVPPCLEVAAQGGDGTVMGLRHRAYPIEGVQFHPEAVLTAAGRQLLANFVEEKSGDTPGHRAVD